MGAACARRPVLFRTLFRNGFLGAFLVDHGSIVHIAPSSSESGGSADRAHTPTVCTVIAVVTVVVVAMSSTPRPSLASGWSAIVGAASDSERHVVAFEEIELSVIARAIGGGGGGWLSSS